MIPAVERITAKSRKDPETVFTSIGHFIDADMLIQCYRKLDGNKAVGIDGITKDEYGRNLRANVEDLVRRIRDRKYHPQPARRVEIPKDNGKTRPLAIYCFEDKLVQQALKEILEAVFEPHFYNQAYGFRPRRGCHMALRALDKILTGRTSWVLDSDIKGFFDHLDHKQLIGFVRKRITERAIIWLVDLMLKAGVMKDGAFTPTEEGSGQGSVCSPVLANIYMHYVLLWWHNERIIKCKTIVRGDCGIVNYADDFVICFQYKDDAERYYEHLKRRMGNFGLTLEESKTRLIQFGRFAEANCRKRGMKPETFTFLGFTHYCSTSRNGKFRVKRKTSQKKFRKKLKEINQWLKNSRQKGEKFLIRKLNEILTGYDQYYGITDNIGALSNFHYHVTKLLFKWLNRRSQRKSYTWDSFNRLLERMPLRKARIVVDIYHVAC